MTELEGSIGEADQPRYRVPQMFENPPHLAVLALLQRQGHPGVRALLAVELGADRAIGDRVDGDASGERGEPRRIDKPVHPHLVAPHPAGRRQFEAAGERAVIGQEEEALGIEVEAADRDESRQAGGQRPEHRRPAPLVLMAGDEAGGLMKAPEARPLRLGQRSAVDPDLVLRRHRDCRAGEDGAVDRDPPFVDPAFGVAARAQPGTRHDLGDAFWLADRRLCHGGDPFWRGRG